MKSISTKLFSAAFLSATLSMPAMAAEELTADQMKQVTAGGWLANLNANLNIATIVQSAVVTPIAINVTVFGDSGFTGAFGSANNVVDTDQQ